MTSQEKKKILQQFAELDNHINELNAELEMWWSRTTKTTSTTSSVPGGTSDGTKTERGVERMQRLVEQIDNETDELLILRQKIMTAIKGLSNMYERRVIYLAYIGKTESGKYKRLKLWQIAQELNYSEIRIKQFHGLALLHLKF